MAARQTEASIVAVLEAIRSMNAAMDRQQLDEALLGLILMFSEPLGVHAPS